jgi:hypothetical protein
MAILEILRRLATKWSTPRSATHHGAASPFRLACSLDELAQGLSLEEGLPPSLAEFWQGARGARLFEDALYGQWGLVLLSPEVAAENSRRFFEERTQQGRRGDMIVGHFLGDQDLLLVRCDPEAGDFGTVLVALPLDGREDWYTVAPSLTAFLEKYEQAEGAKFWEVT